MKRLLIAAATTTLLLAAGCSESAEDVNDSVDQEVDIEGQEEVEESSDTSSATYPLTGLNAEGEIENRPIAVMINNHPAARPQTGLVDADIVYEVLAEGEMTRFVAIFHSTLPENVGPVRSAREYHLDLAKGYDAAFITHGWSPGAETDLRAGKIDYLSGLQYDGSLFQRSSDRRAPHNSYITFDNIKTGLEQQGYEWTGSTKPLAFYPHEDIQVVGNGATEIEVNYYNRNYVSFQYDEESGFYHRYNQDSQTVDQVTDEPLELANVFIVETDHRVVDDVGRREIDLSSGGRALLMHSGLANEVQWKNENERIIPVDENGNEIQLKPGATWINIVPSSPGLDETVTYQ